MSSPLLFLHIPKTAGTTLNSILDANFDSGSVLDIYTEEQHQAVRDLTYNRLAEYDLIRGHIFVQDYDEILDGPVPMRVFTFLRDPIERVISEYFFLKRWPRSHLYKYLNENRVTLVDYVTSDIGGASASRQQQHDQFIVRHQGAVPRRTVPNGLAPSFGAVRVFRYSGAVRRESAHARQDGGIERDLL